MSVGNVEAACIAAKLHRATAGAAAVEGEAKAGLRRDAEVPPTLPPPPSSPPPPCGLSSGGLIVRG